MFPSGTGFFHKWIAASAVLTQATGRVVDLPVALDGCGWLWLDWFLAVEIAEVVVVVVVVVAVAAAAAAAAASAGGAMPSSR